MNPFTNALAGLVASAHAFWTDRLPELIDHFMGPSIPEWDAPLYDPEYREEAA